MMVSSIDAAHTTPLFRTERWNSTSRAPGGHSRQVTAGSASRVRGGFGGRWTWAEPRDGNSTIEAQSYFVLVRNDASGSGT